MSDKGKPTDFTPMEPAAPSQWDDSVEFKLTEEARKKLTEPPLPADPISPIDKINEEKFPEDTIADKPKFEPSVVVSEEALSSDTKNPATSSTTVRDYTPDIDPMPSADAVTRVTALPERPQVKSSKLLLVDRTHESTSMAETTTSMVPTGTASAAQHRQQTPAKTSTDTVLRGISILAMLILFEALSLPRLGTSGDMIAPWQLVFQTGGITFHCALFLVVVFMFTAIPMQPLIRAVGLWTASMVALLFAIKHVQFEIHAFGFRGHPTIADTFSNTLSLIVVLIGVVGFPAALFWRSRYTASIGSRIGVAIGFIFVAIVFLAPLGIGGVHSSIVSAAYTTIQSDTALRGDVLSAYLLLAAAVTSIPGVLSFRRPPSTGYAALWASLFITFLGLIPIIQSLYVANFRDGGWKFVMGPLKTALFLYAIVLLVSVTMGHAAGALMHTKKR